MRLLDTNVCIEVLRGNTDVAARLEGSAPSSIRLSAVVKAELFYAAWKSQVPAKNLRSVERFCRPFISLPFDDSAAEIYGRLRADLAGSGTQIGSNDLQIAAIAIANKATLIAHNTSEFSRVAELQIEDWEVA